MKKDTQVVVIGGGVVGASVLYHLTKAGWTDVMLLERRELTAGSTWHAAGGMHTLNGDPNVARLQQYTIQLYEEIERQSGQDCSIHLPGGLMLADTEVRMDFLRMAVARGRYLGMDLELISAQEAADMFPLMDPQYFVGALYDPVEGHVDPTGVTRAYVKCAQQAGAEVHQHTPVTALEQRPDGTWDVRLENGDSIHTEHVVNAGGLWAREVGRMVGIELPVLAMEHHYLITEDMPEVAAQVAKTGHEMPMALDFAGEIYIRQEGGAMLMGTYEQACVPWSPRETPWDFGSQLLKPQLDRITPELSVAFKHYPPMHTVGIRRVVNGPFTFSPDGNPLVGPIRGLRGYWVACAVMAGLSQGGGVGLALANWMTAGDDGDSGMDIWAMDVARYGDYATLGYTNAKVQENYRRRFRITFPNEELPAGRPLLTTPIYDRLTAANAVWGATFGLEHALWFQKAGLEPKEDVTFRRSNAWECVAEEVNAVRERVGMTEISNYAKYRVTGPGAESWLSSLLTQRMPAPGRITLTAMLNEAGSDRRRVHGRPCVGRRRVLPVRLPPGRGPPLALVPPPSAGRRLGAVRGAGPGADRSVDHGAARPRCPQHRRPRPRPVDRGLPVHDVPAGRSRHGPRARGADQLLGRSGLRAVGRSGIPAGAVRPDRRGRRAARSAAVRHARPDVAPAREELRNVVPRVPPDLYAGRGRHHQVHQARPRLHRASRARGRARGRWPQAPARGIRRRARPRRPCRCHRRRAGVARRGGRRLGHVGWLPPSREGVTRPGLRADRARDTGRPGRERVRDRDHRESPPGAAAARAAVRPDGRKDAPVTDRSKAGASADAGRIVVDGRPVAFEPGESVAVAILRTGATPAGGGPLCLSGDCGNCLAQVDGVAYVRTCQERARPGLAVVRHPPDGLPPLPTISGADLSASLSGPDIEVLRAEVDVAVIGAGDSGREAASTAERAGKRVLILDAEGGDEVVGLYPGPMVVVRTPTLMLHVYAREIVVATGAAELHPVVPGSQLEGIVTSRAAQRLHAAGVDMGAAIAVGTPPAGVPCIPVAGQLIRLEGDEQGRVRSVVTADDWIGAETTTPCDTVIVGLGFAPRDVLARMAGELPLSVVGAAAQEIALPPAPTAGIVCPCSGTTVDDLQAAWDRGFQELELLKRASLACLGTCQGSACLPHVRAWIAARTGEVPAPFTARPASRQITLAEAAADTQVDVFRRTPLHDEHLALGGRLDRFGNWWRPWHYGDAIAEYWSVREGVSVGDVSTLGKVVVSGPDVVEFLERLYPCHVADIRPGRSRYALLLNERGHIMDDGMILREAETRFVLTFTSGGAANAEMWLRDWVDEWGLRVHVMDRTMSLAAINVTGPLAGQLLQRAGLADPPSFLGHVHADVAGVPCHVMRLSFTGEASWELHHPVDRSVELWRALLAMGEEWGIRPHGLKALFGLRLEKGHVIVGMDTELDTTPRRVGMPWAVRMDKPAFIGRAALERTAKQPDHRRLRGFTMQGDAPIEGSPIFVDGEIVGHISGSWASPILEKTVMLGWLKRLPFAETVQIDGREAVVTPTPFYDPEGHRARA